MTTTSTRAEHGLILADLLDPPALPPSKLARYFNDPVGFVKDCFRWEPDTGPTAYQEHELASLVEHKRVAIRGPHGLGKTTDKAWVILWFALTREDAAAHGDIRDWKVLATASVAAQLTEYLWPEIEKWVELADWDRIGRPPFTRFELQSRRLILPHGRAVAISPEKPSGLEGAHAEQILYLFDEAKAIAAGIFDAAEGAFSGAGSGKMEAYAVASSTPGDPSGRFYDIHARRPGLEDWFAIHVTLEQCIAAGRISRAWAEQRKALWGENSAIYANRVLGEFHSSETDAVIPLSWIEAAVQRHKALHAEQDDGVVAFMPNFTCVGVDVGHGNDLTVFALRHGHVITELREDHHADTMVVAGIAAGILRANGGYAVVDVNGWGAGTGERLAELGLDSRPFMAQSGVGNLVDRSGEMGFVNKRSAAWWALREALDPAFDPIIALPDDDRLIGDLVAPRYKYTSAGKIRVESKQDIEPRIGRSTDHGDAVVQAFWMEPREIDEVFEQADEELVHISEY